ncbi:MAG: glycosyltransferase [Actinobacteria bacterium]|nr:glycosyltransferase [Actinomycetota bacterium]
MHKPMLSIIMPVYNEAATLTEVVPKVLSAPCPLETELVLVDDCSSDGSFQLAQALAKEHPQMRVFHHEVNQGKGAAIRTAIQHLRGDYAIIQDADLEYDPNEYGILLEPLLAGKADVVYGSRFLNRYDRAKYHPQRLASLSSSLLGNRVVSSFCNLLNGLHLTDMETCYKLIPVEILRQLPLRSGRFGIEPEITIRLAKLKLRIYEVPISYFPRQYHQGKKINWKDGLAALWHIVRFRFLD